MTGIDLDGYLVGPSGFSSHSN